MNAYEFEKMEDAQVFSESIVNTVREFLVILDEDLKVVSANRAFYRKFKVRRQETEGNYIYTLGNNQWDIPALRDLLERIIPENEFFEDFEIEHNFPDIGYRIMHLNARKVIQEGARKSLILLAIEDVTERIATRRALEESEALYNRLVEEINSIIIEIDFEGKILFFNRFSEHIFGYSRNELIGKQLVGTILPETDSEGRDNTGLIAGVLRDPDRYYFNENVGVKKNGTEVWFSWSARKVEGPKKNITILIDGNDITQEREARRATRNAHKIINEASNAIIRIDHEKRFRFVNRSFAELVGKSFEELEGTMLECANLPASTLHKVNAAVDTAARLKTEQIVETAYGDRHILVRVEPDYEKEGLSGFVIFVRDITERKQIEDQLRQAQKMEAIGRLAGGTAHEFNNMLSVVLGYAELLESRLDKESTLNNYVQEIQKAANRSAEVTNQLLAYSRKQMVRPKVIDLNRTIEAQTNLLDRIIGEEIEIRFYPGEDLWPVRIDPYQVDQILSNLAVNARDAIYNRGQVVIITDNKHVSMSNATPDLPPGDYVRLTFADTGTGMDADTLKEIFEPYFTTKKIGKGIGLGLATVYGIVKQNNGSVYVESKLGKGTTFTIFFPRSREIKDENFSKKSNAPEGNETILVVEDEHQILDLAEILLKDSGYNVLKAATPREAIEIARQRRIDLLLSDVIMPDMNGKMLQLQIERLQPEIKTVFMSGYADDVIAEKILGANELDLIRKPFTVQSLTGKVREVFKRSS